MDKLFFEKRIKSIFRYKKDSFNVFKNQMENYYLIKENYKPKKHNYKIGDDVILEKGTFMRGEGALLELTDERLSFIAKNGFLSPDITKTYNKSQKTPLTIPVWNIQEKCLLKDYINQYSGATIKKYSFKEKIASTELIAYKNIDNYVNNLTDCWNWSMEQTKEIRFMPSLASDRIQISFIMDLDRTNEYISKLVSNDIFNLEFNKKVLKTFIAKWFIDKFIYTKRDHFTTNRESAIIFGIPECLITGILVGRNYENDKDKLKSLKDKFPNCYICNLDGKVIEK